MSEVAEGIYAWLNTVKRLALAAAANQERPSS
jgi:hypothetical protein